jgi:hypothetical protein
VFSFMLVLYTNMPILYTNMPVLFGRLKTVCIIQVMYVFSFKEQGYFTLVEEPGLIIVLYIYIFTRKYKNNPVKYAYNFMIYYFMWNHPGV